jgi:hypothetical protein
MMAVRIPRRNVSEKENNSDLSNFLISLFLDKAARECRFWSLKFNRAINQTKHSQDSTQNSIY